MFPSFSGTSLWTATQTIADPVLRWFSFSCNSESPNLITRSCYLYSPKYFCSFFSVESQKCGLSERFKSRGLRVLSFAELVKSPKAIKMILFRTLFQWPCLTGEKVILTHVAVSIWKKRKKIQMVEVTRRRIIIWHSLKYLHVTFCLWPGQQNAHAILWQ